LPDPRRSALLDRVLSVQRAMPQHSFEIVLAACCGRWKRCRYLNESSLWAPRLCGRIHRVPQGLGKWL